jgi:hypothetical protein
MTVISVRSDDHVTILGQMLRRSERRKTAIYLRDGFLWVADYVDGHGHLIDAKSWLRFNCGGISAQARRRMALESASPVADDLAERIEALHRAMAAAKDGQS